MSKADEDIELVYGSGNVFRDFDRAGADVQQTKALLAARIIGILDDEWHSTRKAESRTGVNHADFARIRNVQLDRFTIDRLMTVLNELGQRVDVQIEVHPEGQEGDSHFFREQISFRRAFQEYNWGHVMIEGNSVTARRAYTVENKEQAWNIRPS